MTENKLSIHVESGDIFYDNHNTDENFYSFLLSQQNDEAAYVPKKIHIRTVLKHILVLFYKVFQSMTKKSLIFLPLKIQNIFFIVLMISYRHLEILDISYFTLEKCSIVLE